MREVTRTSEDEVPLHKLSMPSFRPILIIASEIKVIVDNSRVSRPEFDSRSCQLFINLIKVSTEKMGSSCTTAVLECTPRNREVVGSNSAGC